MKRLVILLAVCTAAFAAKLTLNDIEDMTDFKRSSENEVSEAMSNSLHPEMDEINNFLLQNLDVTKFNKALDKDHPHAYLNSMEIAQLYNYSTEAHHVVTSDGYILELHRITGNQLNPSPKGKPAIFLMHGILASSSDWVLVGPQRGLAFLLADAGYDVWMGNSRGNRYSRNHTTLDTSKKPFWTFTWHEIGIYDLPAMIDYVLEHTKTEKLTYIGHSQGSTSFFVMLSERPEYNDKIKIMFSLAPVAYCSHMYSPFLKYFAKYDRIFRAGVALFGPWEVLPNTGWYKKITQAICKGPLQKLCSNVMFLISGFNEEQMDMDLLPAITAHLPAGSSIYQLSHYSQLIISGDFRQFDDKIIGSSNPPYYNLDNVKVPISLHYADNDWLSDSLDVKILKQKLPNVVGLTEVPDKLFNHIDFLYAKDVKTLLYDGILKTVAKYNNM